MVTNMGAIRVQIRKLPDQPRREILIEEQHQPLSPPECSPLALALGGEC